MISLNVESAFSHVGIAPSHRKYFASHLAIPAFVKGIFFPLQSGGYCSVLQARQQPSISVHRHSQSPSSLLLSDYRMEPLHSSFTMDGQPTNMDQCYERSQLCAQEPRYKNNPLCRRSLKPAVTTSKKPSLPERLSRRPSPIQESQDRLPRVNGSHLKFCSITSATPSPRKGPTAKFLCQSVDAVIYGGPPNTCYG